MTEGVKLLRFFLGANSPQGFVSRFDQLERREDSWNTYIIKGGPGSGKSTLMKKLAKAMEKECSTLEEIYCSSDSASLDGVILHGPDVSVADGTPPHLLEPKFPGAYDRLINLCDCWDEEKLQAGMPEIAALSRRISSLHAQSTRFLGAYGALAEDNRRIALEFTNRQKIVDYARHLALREMKSVHTESPREDVRFLSAISDRGVVLFEETACALAERIYVVDDEHGAASRILLEELRRLALARGYDIITCYCPTAPLDGLEHLFIPALSLGFMTSNRIHPLNLEPYRVVHARRFTSTDAMRLKKQRLAFNRKAAAEMLDQSLDYLAAAKTLHDELEHYYIQAADFMCLDDKYEETLERIRAGSAARRTE